jgi:hypothetical protein
LTATEERNIWTGGRQPQSDCPTQPAGRTGHDDGRARQSFTG